MGGCTSIFSPTIGRLATAWFVWCLLFPPCCGMPPWCTPTVLCYYLVLVTLWSCVLSYPAPSIPVFAPRSLIPARLHLHCAPRSLIIEYCTSPLPCLPLGFSAVFILFPRQAEITFFFLQFITDSSWRQLLQALPLSQVLLTSVFLSATENTEKKTLLRLCRFFTTFFLNPKGGECTVDRAHLRPQSTERTPARRRNTNIHAHRQTLLRYRPRERVFESDFLSVFRHK